MHWRSEAERQEVHVYARLRESDRDTLDDLKQLVLTTKCPWAKPPSSNGDVLGHLLLGYNLSLSSMFGLVALSGVVVNDSLLLVDAINQKRKQTSSTSDDEKTSLVEAAVSGGARRFRPVLITSLTTFGGLSPMMFETGVQAKFLVPMALSLGFGILLAPLVLVFVVPVLFLILEDMRRGLRRLFGTRNAPQKSSGQRRLAEISAAQLRERDSP